MAFKSRSDLVGKRFLCIYANHCTDHYSDTNNNNKTTNSNQSTNSTSSTNLNLHPTKNNNNHKTKDCTDKCLNSISKLKTTKIEEWPWKSGIIRASSHRDSKNSELSVSIQLKLI